MMTYPTVARTEAWYRVTNDGFTSLWTHIGSSTRRPHLVQEETWYEVQGMSEAEFIEYIKRKKEDHEVAATLALLATCEGAIREDMKYRVSGRHMHHRDFKRLANQAGHTKLSGILGKWETILQRRPTAHAAIGNLMTMYRDTRNSLAHGRSAYNALTFVVVLRELRRIETSWKNAVGDFRGFR